jgi:tetratricopeptide (TPR) repeat protein
MKRLQERFNVWLTRVMAFSYFQMGMIYSYMGNATGLVERYEAAVDAFNQAAQWDPTLARAYLERGILYWREMNHPRRAIHDLTTAFALDPNLAEAQFNRAVAHQELREYEEAIADFEGYLRIGEHPHWRRYAATMIHELREWVPQVEAVS